ncbi:class I SAM-dependent methyltransferase [Candidatus Woesearchaeota archaeon]|nr:class I SAM-dependent methyltransferase [Candidatus Woesearchaeota archaeon]
MDSQQKKTIGFYNEYAKQYSEYTFPKLFQYQLNQFVSFLNGKKVLDAGCGAGRDVEYLTEEKLDVIGIDISDNMLKEARKRVKGAKFKKMDLLDIKLKPKSFDGVWCSATLLHFRKRDAPKVLKNFHNVLKKDGVVYISAKEGEGEKVLDSGFIKAPRFFSFYKQVELEILVEENGFEIITSYSEKAEETNWLNIFARKV